MRVDWRTVPIVVPRGEYVALYRLLRPCIRWLTVCETLLGNLMSEEQNAELLKLRADMSDAMEAHRARIRTVRHIEEADES